MTGISHLATLATQVPLSESCPSSACGAAAKPHCRHPHGCAASSMHPPTHHHYSPALRRNSLHLTPFDPVLAHTVPTNVLRPADIAFSPYCYVLTYYYLSAPPAFNVVPVVAGAGTPGLHTLCPHRNQPCCLLGRRKHWNLNTTAATFASKPAAAAAPSEGVRPGSTALIITYLPHAPVTTLWPCQSSSMLRSLGAGRRARRGGGHPPIAAGSAAGLITSGAQGSLCCNLPPPPWCQAPSTLVPHTACPPPGQGPASCLCAAIPSSLGLALLACNGLACAVFAADLQPARSPRSLPPLPTSRDAVSCC